MIGQNRKNSDILVVSQGEWKVFKQSPLHKQKLEKVAGMIYLQDNDEPDIILQIIQLKFPRLLKLSLQSNNISSIEALTYLSLPRLVELQLGDNKINSIKSLRRCEMPFLKLLSLRRNKINEMHYLQEGNFIISHAMMEWHSDEATCAEATWCVKLETWQLRGLNLESRKRIIQSRLYQVLKCKFPNLKLSYDRTRP